MQHQITNQQLVKLSLAIKNLLREKGIFTSPSFGDIYRKLRGELISLGIDVEDEPQVPEEPIEIVNLNDLIKKNGFLKNKK